MTQHWNLLPNIDPNKDQPTLKHDAVDKLFLRDVPTSGIRNPDPYSERPSRYMIILKGERIKRRVYTTPIGNVSVMYIKTKQGVVFCETAVDEAVQAGEP
jgi:hypothetical protein